MNEIDFKIRNELYKSLQLLGAKSDLLGTIGSWKDTLSDEDVLVSIKAWNQSQIKEMEGILSSCTKY